MSVRTRLERLEAAMPAEEEPEGEVVIVCDDHGPECRADVEHPLGAITVRLVDYSVFELPRTAPPEVIERLRREVAGASAHTIH